MLYVPTALGRYQCVFEVRRYHGSSELMRDNHAYWKNLFTDKSVHIKVVHVLNKGRTTIIVDFVVFNNRCCPPTGSFSNTNAP
jgi:hypothetical protein